MGYRINKACDTGGIPLYLINRFLKHIKIPTLVETGTAAGGSVKEAASYFENCHTIELNPERPIKEDAPQNIIWHTGSSIEVLPEIVYQLIQKKAGIDSPHFRYAMFWLDSHFDGDKPSGSKYKDCYLLEELEIISEYSQDSIIIIDDARLFMGNPPHPNEPKEWPNLQQIFKMFDEKFPYFFVTIIDDYIIALPDRVKWIFDEEWVEGYKIRYPDEPEVIRNAAKLAYNSFIKYIQ